MGRLIIERHSERLHQLLNIRLYVNGEEVGIIGNNESLTLDLQPGNHTLMAKMDWRRSQTLEVQLTENEQKKIQLSGYIYGSLILNSLWGILLLYYISKYVFEADLSFLIPVAGVGFLYPLYFMSFGKNNYLRLIEMNK